MSDALPTKPLAGFTTRLVAQSLVMLGLETVADAAALRDGRLELLRKVMTPQQARELGEALLRAATKAERSPPAGTA